MWYLFLLIKCVILFVTLIVNLHIVCKMVTQEDIRGKFILYWSALTTTCVFVLKYL